MPRPPLTNVRGSSIGYSRRRITRVISPSALDLMLMERRPNVNVSADEWQAWLVKCVRENKPWNVLAKEIIQADGADPATRPAARFTLDRGTDPNMLTRDIGRIFFGRDMQCAQCHDHPIVKDYLQSDYQGLFAFLQPTIPIVRKDGDKQTTLEAERAGAQVSFQSVFVHTPRRTVARVPDGVMIDEPFFLPGDEYVVPPGDNVKSVPKFSYRAKLAELATNGSNEAFNRNIANRLWALMFGRGLVHPVDMQNPDNPPSNPELLQLLARQIAAMKFDMRAFLREIALSNAYQRSFDPPADLASLADKAAKEAARLQEARVPFAKTADASTDAYTKADGRMGTTRSQNDSGGRRTGHSKNEVCRCQEESRRRSESRCGCGITAEGEKDGCYTRSAGSYRRARSR